MKTTTDEYELPIAVADSPSELAKMIGLKANSVISMISRGAAGYHKVEIDETEKDFTQLSFVENGNISPCPYSAECLNNPAGCKGISYWCKKYDGKRK